MVCMCPTTEADLADGVGPARALASAGSPLSLGSDSHAVIDLLEEARRVELGERLITGQRGSFTATALARAATVAGHACLGWPEAGEIAPPLGDRTEEERRGGPGRFDRAKRRVDSLASDRRRAPRAAVLQPVGRQEDELRSALANPLEHEEIGRAHV